MNVMAESELTPTLNLSLHLTATEWCQWRQWWWHDDVICTRIWMMHMNKLTYGLCYDFDLCLPLNWLWSGFDPDRCTTQRGVSTFMDGCDLTPIYSVCATRDISECGSLNKGLNHQTMNQQTRKFSIKAVTALKIQNLNYHTLTSDFSNLRWAAAVRQTLCWSS